MPAEWEPQAGVCLTWPHAETDWAPRLDRVMPTFAAIGGAIARREPLLSLCRDEAHVAQAREHLLDAGALIDNLRFATVANDDTWSRDFAPLTALCDGEPQLNGFEFNGWGGKFYAERDNAVSAKLVASGAFGDTPWTSRALVLEGGAIETDGQGTLLATRSSVITPSRNPGLGQADYEALLSAWLGFDRFLWLDDGTLSGDDTDGHIDTLARFADPETILFATAPPGDDDHAALRAMRHQLETLRTRAGRPYRLLPLPFPGVHVDDGRRLPASYANFLVINGAVLLPTYGVDADIEAVKAVAEAFPGRQVVAIDCRSIIAENGSLHCLTMQFPAGVALAEARAFAA